MPFFSKKRVPSPTRDTRPLAEALPAAGAVAMRLHREAEEILSSASVAEGADDRQLAQALYEQATEVLLRALKADVTESLQTQLRARATFALDRAEKLGLPKSLPPPLARVQSAKLSEIAAIRAVVGDKHSDDALRVLLAKHGDDPDAVINELLEELITDFQTEEEAAVASSSSSSSGRAKYEVGASRQCDMWQCPQCTLENRLVEAVCMACEHPRTNLQEVAAASAARPVSAPGASASSSRAVPRARVLVPPRAPQTLEEFVSSSIGGDVRLVMHLELPGGETIQVTRALPAAQMRSQLIYLAQHPDGSGGGGGGYDAPPTAIARGPHEAWAQEAPQEPPISSIGTPSIMHAGSRPGRSAAQQPRSTTPAKGGPERSPAQPPAIGPSGQVAGGVEAFSVPSANQGAFGGVEAFSVPSANQGAFGGERVGPQLPQHSSRQGTKVRGPRQQGLREKVDLAEVRQQLGDGAVREAIARALARSGADDGNAPVNADIRSDAPLYDDGAGAPFERSIYVDPGRSSRSKGAIDVPPEQQLASIRPPKPGTAGHADSLPVAYEVAAVGSRLRNMARVGGQRVLEMYAHSSRPVLCSPPHPTPALSRAGPAQACHRP